MTRMKATYLDPAVGQYLLAHTHRPDDVLDALAVETRELTGDSAGMQISPDQGRFLTMIPQLGGARNAVEVGTFTGYSSICLARGLGPGGGLHLLRRERGVDGDRPALLGQGRVADRIELGSARRPSRLRELPADAAVDLAFIDADKVGYPSTTRTSCRGCALAA